MACLLLLLLLVDEDEERDVVACWDMSHQRHWKEDGGDAVLWIWADEGSAAMLEGYSLVARGVKEGVAWRLTKLAIMNNEHQ